MKIRKYILPIVSMLAMASCNYEDINTNVYGVTNEDMKQGGLLYGTAFMDMQKLVIPIGSPVETTGPGNDLANTDIMSAGNYIGYWGMNNNWNNNTEANWNFVENRMSYAFSNFYSKIFRSWNEIHKHTKNSTDISDKAVNAVANIVKITAWLRATDVFGPIVYTNAGNGDIAPKPDSQEMVYKAMMADLHEAAMVLSSSTSKVLPKYDVIYDGNPQNWAKLANSLLLRMAVRVHFVDEALSRDYIAKALDPAFGGVIEDESQEAKIMNSAKMPLRNSMLAIVDDYNEARMGTTIWSYLDGYGDERESAYFLQGTFRYRSAFWSVAPTNNQPKQTGANTAEFASKPRVDANSPLYWLRASEVYFLKAEAALYNLIAGDPRTYYEQGVSMSFRENGKAIGDYLSKTTMPKDVSFYDMVYSYAYSCNISPDNVSPQWDEDASEEKKLQQIITQKYLALYPNAVEAWTEYRRTGYPYLMRPADKVAFSRIGGNENDITPERFKYPASEGATNPNFKAEAIQVLLNGEDIGATKLWWVRPNRPQQP